VRIRRLSKVARVFRSELFNAMLFHRIVYVRFHPRRSVCSLNSSSIQHLSNVILAVRPALFHVHLSVTATDTTAATAAAIVGGMVTAHVLLFAAGMATRVRTRQDTQEFVSSRVSCGIFIFFGGWKAL
jgi:cytochrome c biogenesis protein CcdA